MALTPDRVLDWGKHAHGSPLYAHLVEVIASDKELMRVINRIPHLPQVNVLLGAVHMLLMKGGSEELAAYYASLTEEPRPHDDIDSVFRDFVLAHEADLVEIGEARYTQTNECRRCIALLPAVMSLGAEGLHLVEIGSSVGLNLALDRYYYSYDNGALTWGPESPVLLTAELRGVRPRLHDIMVLSRTGLDLNPIDPSNPDDRLWLDALVWPEHHERRDRLRAALVVTATLDINAVRGDALETLPSALAGISGEEPVVVMNSFALNQVTPEERKRVQAIVDEARQRRPVYRVSFEFMTRDEDWPVLAVDKGDGLEPIGHGHPHGEWLSLEGEVRPARRRGWRPRLSRLTPRRGEKRRPRRSHRGSAN